MKVRTQVALLAALSLATQALATTTGASADELGAIEVHTADRGGTVIIKGSHPPVFSVFRLSDPDRIIVDLAGADVSKAKAPERDQSGIAGLGQISAVQFQKGDTRVGRVVLNADPKLAYDVKVVGNDVVVALSAEAGGLAPSAPIAPPTGSAATEPAPAPDDHLIERMASKGSGRQVGHRVVSVSSGDAKDLTLSIRTDGSVGDVVLLRLRDPSRVAVDFPGFDAKGAKIHSGSSTDGIRLGKIPGGTRIVFDLKNPEVPELTCQRTAVGVSILPKRQPPAPASVATAVVPVSKSPVPALADTPVAASRATVSQPPAPVATASVGATKVVPQPVEPAITVAKAAKQTKALAVGVGEIRDLRVTGDAAVQEVVLDLPAGMTLSPPKSIDGSGYELALHGVAVPEKLRRTLDATAFNGPVATVSSFNVSPSEGRVVVSAAAGTHQSLKQDGTTATWKFTRPVEAAAEVSIDGAKVASMQTEQEQPQVAGFTTAAAETSNELPRRTHYTGRRISLEFKDIDIQNLLRLFADISHKNIVVADDVKGKVTIALRNVPWDQAFDLILKTHGLGKEESGNIVRVAPEDQLDKERKAALDARKAKDLLEPLRVRLIPVNYALAGEVSDKIKDVLSERGVVTVDSRTNVLIVKDVADNLAKAEGMVRNLDTQTPQVLIESRIVEASTQFNREVGIQWGGNGGFSPVNANSTGLVFPSTATVAGAAGGSPNLGTAANPNFAVNLPAAIGQGAGGGLGFIFGSAGGAINLNLRISALEDNGIVKTVSAPKVATLDNQEATISQGVSIPFAQVSAAGVQTAFIEARLELKVTPHVTSDGSVLLKISASNNQPNSGITGANGQPSISRKEAKTQMLVRDGDTSVIGGIYTRQTGVSINQVPLFGNIPILGWLFKHRADTDARTELLVFITPRILNRQQIVASGN